MEMYCYQCEQSAGGRSCSTVGICGKDSRCAGLQDIIVHQVKVLGWYLKQNHVPADGYSSLLYESLFATMTNVDFDENRLAKYVAELNQSICKVKNGSSPACGDITIDSFEIPAMLNTAQYFTLANRRGQYGDTIAGMQELILYGLKGTASYLKHAREFTFVIEEIDSGFVEALAFLASEPMDLDQLVLMALRAGELNYMAMALLDDAHTTRYGHPEPTSIKTTQIPGKCILVSGHDIHDLELLLKQTAGKNINVYTHGELLPALAYPGLKKYPHLAGNYGGAWQDQQREFADFPGAILVTTNCIQQPLDEYKDRVFTSGPVAWPGTIHIGEDKDFSAVICCALAEEGFTSNQQPHEILIGFARNTLHTISNQIVDAVKSGKIRHFFLVGGCDGARQGRSYYTEFAKLVPKDSIIFTLACGKYRFNKKDFGSIAGIPRLMDIGQCNDTYSAISIALMLADGLNCSVNELPLTFVLSWYEQKAVAILLTLLHLGVRNIKLGPTMPAFITPEMAAVLAESFNLKPVTTAAEDLKEILSRSEQKEVQRV